MSKMDTPPLYISLSDMLDLALGTPEIGAINLNILHNFLHILLQLNGLQSTQLEYKGKDANKIESMLSTSLKYESNNYMTLHDYSLKDSCQQKDKPEKSKLLNKIDECETINLKGKADEKINEPTKSTNCTQHLTDAVDLTLSTCKKLEESMKQLEQRFLTLEQLVNESKNKYVSDETDNFTVKSLKLNDVINTQLDTEEQDIIVTLPSDKRKIVSNNKIKRESGGGDVVEQVVSMSKRLSKVEDNINSLDKNMSQLQNQNNEMGRKLDNISNSNLINASSKVPPVNECEHELQTVKQQISSSQEAEVPCSSYSFNTEPTTEQLQKEVLGEVNCPKLRADIMKADMTLTQMKAEICDLREKIYEISKVFDFKDSDKNKSKRFKKCAITPEGGPDDNYIVIKQKQTDLKPSRCADLIHEVEESIMNTIQCINKRLECFEEYVNCSLRNISDTIMKNKNEEELMKYVYAIRSDFEDMRKAVCELLHFRECQIQRNDVFQEQIEVLKTIKANKEEVEAALADKADICDLNKKVSHEQFDAVVDAMNLNFEDLMTKINQQESMWQQSIAELRIEFDGKIEEMEIPAFKECVNKELESLKNQVRILSQMKREQEAAGARKILRDLRCISCDKDAFMQTNSAAITGKPFPCRPTMHPCISFKIDRVRQQQKFISQGKKMTNLEKIMAENSDNNKSCPENCEIDNREHICSRYCGGSHTILGPQQRVTSSKNKAQWNMHEQMIEGFVEGTDGRMYKGRWIPGQKS